MLAVMAKAIAIIHVSAPINVPNILPAATLNLDPQRLQCAAWSTTLTATVCHFARCESVHMWTLLRCSAKKPRNAPAETQTARPFSTDALLPITSSSQAAVGVSCLSWRWRRRSSV